MGRADISLGRQGGETEALRRSLRASPRDPKVDRGETLNGSIFGFLFS